MTLVTRGLLALLVVTVASAATATSGASFTATSANPANVAGTLVVQAPGSLTAIAASGGAIALSWSASPTSDPSHTLSYVVYRAPLAGAYTAVGATSASVLTYNDTPPGDGTYRYVVRAKVSGTGSFTSADSPSASALSDTTPPTTVTNLVAAPGTKGTPATINLTWTAAVDALSGLRGYEIRWTNIVTSCPVASTTSYPNSTTVGAVTAATIPPSGTLTNGAKYCAYLVSIDNSGNRSAASVVVGPTPAK